MDEDLCPATGIEIGIFWKVPATQMQEFRILWVVPGEEEEHCPFLAHAFDSVRTVRWTSPDLVCGSQTERQNVLYQVLAPRDHLEDWFQGEVDQVGLTYG